MAARLNKLHQETVKQKIKGSQLINFLQNHALDGTEASATRIDAAKYLLGKIISNAPTEVNHGSDPERPMIARVEWQVRDPKA